MGGFLSGSSKLEQGVVLVVAGQMGVLISTEQMVHISLSLTLMH